MSIFYSGGPKSLVLSHHSVIVPYCVVPTFPMENLRRKQITQLVGGGLHLLPSLTYSTGRLRIQVLPSRCQHLGLLQSRVMWGKRQGGTVHGIHFAGGQRGVILALVSSFGAAEPRQEQKLLQGPVQQCHPDTCSQKLAYSLFLQPSR